ncbi:Translocon-associated protein subunit alpha [Eufriesea mexicana]|nr:Translocon-associated protein subunit alpha [Eufriesea mexicana]
MFHVVGLTIALPSFHVASRDGSQMCYCEAVWSKDENIDDIVDIEGEDNSVITDEEPEDETTTASSDADTTILFTKPVYSGLSTLELPAGNLVEFLVGFTNKGESDFVLESLDASFRYAMDFNFYIQNFSTVAYNKIVKPKHEATLAYSFIPEAVYNETVQIIELDDGLDGETIFLYVFLAACVILILVGGQQLLSSLGRKSRSSNTRKTPVEMGTSNPNNVDYDWLPKETLNRISLIGEFHYLMDPMVLSILYVWCQLNKDALVNFLFGSQFKAIYLPWVLFAFNLIVSGGGTMELFGILVGHLYVFFKFKYPQELGGPELLNTPKILETYFPSQRGNIRRFGAAPVQRTQAQQTRNIFGGHNWGRGHVLGE